MSHTIGRDFLDLYCEQQQLNPIQFPTMFCLIMINSNLQSIKIETLVQASKLPLYTISNVIEGQSIYYSLKNQKIASVK